MEQFKHDAKALLEAIGGKENISAVTHCATRMRFVLNDSSKAKVKVIEELPSVKGTFTNAGQFQVIIGNDVPIFYNAFVAVSVLVLRVCLKRRQNRLPKKIKTLYSVC